jgi:hypothetical protein
VQWCPSIPGAYPMTHSTARHGQQQLMSRQVGAGRISTMTK